MCRTWLWLALVVVVGVDSYPQRWRRDISESALSEPALSEPALPEPALSEPALSEPALSEPALSEPALSEPDLSEPALSEPVLSDPAPSKHTLSQRDLSEPALSERDISEPALPERTVSEPAVSVPARYKPRRASRQGKSLGFYQPSYMSSPLMLDPEGILPYEDALAAALASATYSEGAGTEDNEILSRTRPTNRRPGNSPIYYIRLPASPYVYIPGVGYVSQPPRLQPPPVVQTRPDSPFLNVPVRFVSNGKPTGVYTLENELPPTRPPPQDSPIINLNKGPYVFNGRPNDIYLLRDAYNSLYDEALTNFYP